MKRTSPFLFLAAGTIMSAPTTDDDSLNGTIAAIAALPSATKDFYGVLHISFLPIRLDVGTYASPLASNP